MASLRTVSTAAWIQSVLPRELEAAWNDATWLHRLIGDGLDAGAPTAVLNASHRLAELEPGTERSVVALAAVLIRLERLDDAVTALKSFSGRSALVLTQRSKIASLRGDDRQAFELASESVTVSDAPLSSFEWWVALGRASNVPTLERAGTSWQADVLRARALLSMGDAASASEALERALTTSKVKRDVVREVMTLPAESIARLVGTLYSPEVHGFDVGPNVVRALVEAGSLERAESIVRELRELGAPVDLESLQSILIAGRSNTARDAAQLRAVPIEAPLWNLCLPQSQQLVSQSSGPTFAFVQVCDVRAQENAGPVTRALTLFLAERVRLRTSARALAVIPVFPPDGLTHFSAPWTLEAALRCCPTPSPEFAVIGTVSTDPTSAESTVVQLTVFETRSAREVTTVTAQSSEGVSTLAAALERRLVNAVTKLGVESVAVPDSLVPEPTEESLASLDDLLAQVLVAKRVLSASAVGSPAAAMQGYLDVASAAPSALSPKLMALTALATQTASAEEQRAFAEVVQRLFRESTEPAAQALLPFVAQVAARASAS